MHFRVIWNAGAKAILLPQLVTSITRDRRMVRLVAVHARFHSSRNFLRDDIALPNNAVALMAFNGRLLMARMTEENEILDCVDLACRERLGIVAERRQTPDLLAIALHDAMTGHAFSNRRKPRPLSGLNRFVTVDAFNFERRVLPVTETRWLAVLRGEGSYGSEKATSESE